jgi:hypothetical protein
MFFLAATKIIFSGYAEAYPYVIANRVYCTGGKYFHHAAICKQPHRAELCRLRATTMLEHCVQAGLTQP